MRATVRSYVISAAVAGERTSEDLELEERGNNTKRYVGKNHNNAEAFVHLPLHHRRRHHQHYLYTSASVCIIRPIETYQHKEKHANRANETFANNGDVVVIGTDDAEYNKPQQPGHR